MKLDYHHIAVHQCASVCDSPQRLKSVGGIPTCSVLKSARIFLLQVFQRAYLFGADVYRALATAISTCSHETARAELHKMVKFRIVYSESGKLDDTLQRGTMMQSYDSGNGTRRIIPNQKKNSPH
jgi:hypothetical protein